MRRSENRRSKNKSHKTKLLFVRHDSGNKIKLFVTFANIKTDGSITIFSKHLTLKISDKTPKPHQYSKICLFNIRLHNKTVVERRGLVVGLGGLVIGGSLQTN